MLDEVQDKVNFQPFGGMMRTSVTTESLLLIAFVVLSGCGDGEYSSRSSSAVLRKISAASTNVIAAVEAGAHGENILMSHADAICPKEKCEVERILADDLSSVPFRRRYRAQCDRAYELWNQLGLIGTNDTAYVICAAARLQALWEHDLATVRTPDRTIEPEPVHHTSDGLSYRLYSSPEKVRLVAKETKEIESVEGYLTQLRYFAEDYGIDSRSYWGKYRSLDETSRREVMARVVSILGRSPRWEKWQ